MVVLYYSNRAYDAFLIEMDNWIYRDSTVTALDTRTAQCLFETQLWVSHSSVEHKYKNFANIMARYILNSLWWKINQILKYIPELFYFVQGWLKTKNLAKMIKNEMIFVWWIYYIYDMFDQLLYLSLNLYWFEYLLWISKSALHCVT